jgi:hypothetical protein
MEYTRALLINHLHRRVPQSINNYNHVLIGLYSIGHESLEIRLWKIVLQHRVIKFFPHYLLSLHVFKLHVTNCNGHNFTIGWIVHMTIHNCPTDDMLHMIKHDPSILQIPYKLHSPHYEFMDILKVNTFCPKICPRKQHFKM